MSNPLQSHELQHARLPCPSLSPGGCSNSCLMSLVMPSNHLILCHSLLLLPLTYTSIRVFSNESALHTEKAMATHSSTLAWEIPWTEEPGRLHTVQVVAESDTTERLTSLSLFPFMHLRRKWQPTPVFLPGESQEREPGGLPSTGSQRAGHY